MVTKAGVLPDALFDSLGHATRRQILALLRERPRPVGEIAANLPVSRPAVSKHLRQLRRAGLVRSVRAGTRNVCHLDDTGFAAAREHLERFWTAALDNFQRLAAAERHRA